MQTPEWGQCVPAAIPQNLPPDKVIFSAPTSSRTAECPTSRISCTSISRAYSQLPNPEAMRDVGRAVGRLNKLLPKRQFMLIGPGRWGSRGDIKLGVPVTYSRHQQHRDADRSRATKRKLPAGIVVSALTSSRTWSRPRSAICRYTRTIHKQHSKNCSFDDPATYFRRRSPNSHLAGDAAGH